MKLYAVRIFCKTMEVDSNLPFKIPKLELKWADGQCGALPVFASMDEAVKWCGDPALVVEIETDEEDN